MSDQWRPYVGDTVYLRVPSQHTLDFDNPYGPLVVEAIFKKIDPTDYVYLSNEIAYTLRDPQCTGGVDDFSLDDLCKEPVS